MTSPGARHESRDVHQSGRADHGAPVDVMLVAADLSDVHMGNVEAYDAASGLGSLRHDAGHALDFHCTAIADGTRMIEVGARVAFTVATSHNGTVEARSLVTVGVGVSPETAGPTPRRH